MKPRNGVQNYKGKAYFFCSFLEGGKNLLRLEVIKVDHREQVTNKPIRKRERIPATKRANTSTKYQTIIIQA